MQSAPGQDGSRRIHANSLGECWRACTELVLRRGSLATDEDVGLREVLGVALHIERPSTDDTLIARHGDPQVIERTLAKFRKGVRMTDRPFTYGERIFEQEGVDQFEWLVGRLSSKRDSKSATICLLSPGEEGCLPCLTTIDAKVRSGALHLQFFYRSQNVFGRQYANLLALSRLQADLAGRLDFEIGTLGGYVSSAHIYDFDLDGARRLVEGEDFRISDQYYVRGPASARESLQARDLQVP